MNYQKLTSKFECMVKHITLIVAASIACSPAFAQSHASSILDGFNQPMKSRTCGLILLSDGRAKVRSDDMKNGVSDLIAAFSLLQDGRILEDKAAARTASQKILASSTESKTASIVKCKLWLEDRKTKSDFSKTDVDQWNWANQAMFTAESEKK